MSIEIQTMNIKCFTKIIREQVSLIIEKRVGKVS